MLLNEFCTSIESESSKHVILHPSLTSSLIDLTAVQSFSLVVTNAGDEHDVSSRRSSHMTPDSEVSSSPMEQEGMDPNLMLRQFLNESGTRCVSLFDINISICALYVYLFLLAVSPGYLGFEYLGRHFSLSYPDFHLKNYLF